MLYSVDAWLPRNVTTQSSVTATGAGSSSLHLSPSFSYLCYSGSLHGRHPQPLAVQAPFAIDSIVRAVPLQASLEGTGYAAPVAIKCLTTDLAKARSEAAKPRKKAPGLRSSWHALQSCHWQCGPGYSCQVQGQFEDYRLQKRHLSSRAAGPQGRRAAGPQGRSVRNYEPQQRCAHGIGCKLSKRAVLC